MPVAAVVANEPSETVAPSAPLQSAVQRRQRGGVIVALLVVLTVAVYLPVVGYGFVNWDDWGYVTENPLIRSWRPSNLLKIVSEPHMKNVTPLTTFAYLVQHTLWGLHPGGYHLVNLLLHAANAVLVYRLLRQVAGDEFIAGVAAVLFAVHPVQVESVAWISSLKGLLSSTFILASLICWLRRERTAKHEAYGLLFLLLALLAKAMAVVVPAIVLAYDVWVRRRKLSDAVARQFLPGIAAVMVLLMTISAQATVYGGVREHWELNKLELLAVDAIILWRYVGMLIWPADLSVLYDPPTRGVAWAAGLALLGWGLVVWGAYRLRRRAPLVGWSLFAAFAFLAPVLNFTPITSLMNDRYLYLPSIAAFALFAAGLRQLPEWLAALGGRNRADRAPFVAGWLPAAIVLVVVSGTTVRTHFHLPVWRNSLALWRNAAAEAGDLPVVQYQLADAHFEAGRRGEAIALLEQALQNPRADRWDRERFERTMQRWRTETGAAGAGQRE